MREELVRLRDLYALDIMDGAVVIGGADRMNVVVRDVVLVEPDAVLTAHLPAESAVVFVLGAEDGSVHFEYLLDLLLRRVHTAGARAVIVQARPASIAVATRMLADRLGVPALLAPVEPSALDLAVQLRIAVRAPEVEHSRTLQGLAGRLRNDRLSLGRILEEVGTALGARVWACTAQGVVVEGAEPGTPLPDVVAARTITSYQAGETSVAVLPVAGLAGPLSLWTAAERTGVGAQWRGLAERALLVARGPVLAWLAGRQLAAERDARLRSTLLSEILEHGDAVSGTVGEQATMAGWQLGGWHIGVHLRFPDGAAVPSFTVDALTRELAAAGVRAGPLVERADGWSTWLTSAKAPPADQAHLVARRLGAGLRAFAGRTRELTVAAGVGSPQRDVGGIATTLAEARQAAVIAASSGGPVSVRVVQDLGASRLLLGWYASGAFRDYAEQILRPLVEADEPELLATLGAYLDHSCSATRTSRALRVHRNTVAQRVARIERILGSPLDQPDTRLALQLALRAIRTDAGRVSATG